MSVRSHILFTICIILGLVLLFAIRQVLILIFISFIISSALVPLHQQLRKRNLPRLLSVTLIFSAVLVFIGGVITAASRPLVEQFPMLLQRVTQGTQNIYPFTTLNPEWILNELSRYTTQAINLTLSLFQNLFSFVTIFIVAFYLLLERDSLYALIPKIYTTRHHHYHQDLLQIEAKMGAWLRGQLLAALFVGIVYFLVLTGIGIDLALSLAVLGAIFEFIPLIGPFIAAIPAILIALTISPLTAGIVLLAYVLIQQLESNVIIPVLMNKAVGLNPLLIIIAVIIVSKLLGIIGILLAVPLTVVVQIIYAELRQTNGGESS